MNAPFRVPTSTRTPLIPYSFRSVATVVAGSLPERATRSGSEAIGGGRGGQFPPPGRGARASLPWSRLRRVERGKQLPEPLQLRCIVRDDVRIVRMALGVVLMKRLGRAEIVEPADLGHDGPGEDPPRREVGDGGLRGEPLNGVPVEHDGAVFRTGIGPLLVPLGRIVG